jgi:hypothetical protein
MLALRILFASLSCGLFIGALFSAIDAENAASLSVRANLFFAATLGFFFALFFGACAAVLDHRSPRERRAAMRQREALQRIRYCNERQAQRSRNRF